MIEAIKALFKVGKHYKKAKTSNVMLVVVCVMITLYAAASFALQFFTSVEISPTLTTAWFSFWGAEVISLAGIKISKVIKGENSSSESEEETIE